MVEVVQDYETINPYCDVTIVGSRVYSEHWATEIACLVYTAQGVRDIFIPGANYGIDSRLRALAANPEAMFNCHGMFEFDIWHNIMVPQFGFPEIPIERWHDIQATLALKSQPLSLEQALPHLTGQEKDTAGSKLTISLSRFGKQGRLWREGKGHPKNLKGQDLSLPERTPEVMNRVYSYCATDVSEETALHDRLGYLPDEERDVWLLDQRINNRGVALDRAFLAGARRIVEAARGPLESEFRLLTGGINPGQVKKVVGWMGGQGVPIDNLRKETIAEMLGTDKEDDDDADEDDQRELSGLATLPGNVRRALTIRSLVGSASIRKLSRMEGCIARDGRAHRLLQYHGTGPGRWAGRLFNLLNFPRGTAFTGESVAAEKPKPCDPDTLSRAILTGDADEVLSLGLVVEDPPFSKNWRPADPIEVVSSALRHAVVADQGRLLVVGDFVQIQARVDLALAGQTDFLEKLAAGADPYLLTAERIYGDPEGSLTKDNCGGKRQVGKNTFLGCGFQMGGQTFCQKYVPGCVCKVGQMCEAAESTPRVFANDTVRAYRTKVAPLVPKLWYGLAEAAHETVYTGKPHEAFGIEYAIEELPPRSGMPDGRWLTARLLDGKKIYYWNPVQVQKKLPWKDKPQDAWAYQTVRNKRLQWVYPHGGLLAENVVMGLERQLLVRAMMRCEQENLPVIFNSYDEIVCEVDEARASWPVLEQILEDPPEWAKALKLPIKAEGWVGARYRKG